MEGQNPPMNAPTSTDRHPWLRVPDLIAIGIIAVIAVGAAVVAMMESYTNLLDFAKNHELHGWRAGAAPGAVDSFIIIGELLLFVAIYRGWNQARTYRDRSVPASIVLWGWGLALFGFTLSVLGNLDSRITADVVTRLMSAVFPVSATVALAAGLMILKRVAQDYRRKAETQADIRPHNELLYMLGGPPKPIVPEVPAVAPTPPKRRRAVTPAEPQPALAAAPVQEKQAELPPARPRAVPDPDPQPGQVSRPIEMTDAIWQALESGMPDAELSDRHPSLGSRFRVRQIVKAYREGRLVPGTRENVDGAPVIWAGDDSSEVASGGK